MELNNWGLSERYSQEAQIYSPLLAARVTEQHRNIYRVVSENGFLQASVSGKFTHNATDNADFPTVGDWVMIDASGVIHHVLTRGSVFMRKAAGTAHEPQLVAANVNTVFICMALNSDYNLRRLERYLAIAWDSGASPVVVFTKSDLCSDLEDKLDEAGRVSLGADIIVCSNAEANGYDTVAPYIRHGHTIAFIGSSGVGKSTLINSLLGHDALATREIRQDGKGRHTTTFRQLMLLPDGGLVIDTPGMREIGVVSADFEHSFADIEDLKCKFADCSHSSEPGCAVLAAIADGSLDAARFESYKKLQNEAVYSNLSSKKIEEEKIKRMFGGKGEMKQFKREFKKNNRNR